MNDGTYGLNNIPSLTPQRLRWGEIRQERRSAPETMFTTTGRQLYVLGDIDGGFRPRSNPYDLHAFGKPKDSDPLAHRLQGVWAQPVKALNGYSFVVENNGNSWPLLDAECFTQTFTDVQFLYRRDEMIAIRTDFVPQDHPVLFTTLTLRNEGTLPTDFLINFLVQFDLLDAQFTTLADKPNHGEIVEVHWGDWSPAHNSFLISGQWRLGVLGGRQRLRFLMVKMGTRLEYLNTPHRLNPVRRLR